jgi:NADH:ubiquinone reductase (H+-translocating)
MVTSKSVDNPSPKKQILILGGGYAGITAARRLAHRTKGLSIEITLVNGSSQFVERIRMHQTASAHKLRAFNVPQLLQGTPVRFIQSWVTKIDPVAQTVNLKVGENVPILHYDYMIYALGSAINLFSVVGAAENALSVSDYYSSVELQQRLMDLSQSSGEIIVVGGGLTGIEIATEVAERYPQLHITLMTRESFAENLSPRGQAYTRRVFEGLNIRIMDCTEVTQVNADSVDYTAADDANVRRMAADVTIWAGSFTVPKLARHSGLNVNAKGQVIVDSHLRSVSYPNIYAAGDSASPDDALDLVVDMGCKTAMPMGAYTADDLSARLGGRTWKPFDYGYVVYCISLGRREGLIQFYKPNGEVRNRVLTGWLGAKVKELICQFTILQMRHAGTFLYTRRPAAYHTGKQSLSKPLPGGARS